MSTVRWHTYDLATGILTGHSFSANGVVNGTMPKGMEANIPPGCGVITGAADWKTQKVDLATGQLVPYVREPSAAEKRAAVLMQIQQLEAGQARSIREAIIHGSKDGYAKLAEIDDKIGALRKQL